MVVTKKRQALYYPFHLCHERTLQRLLDEYASIHFRDYMAIQLTKMSGTTAYNDRMGNWYGELITSGRIVQGYNVSGPLDEEMIGVINRDLSDAMWRSIFHHALIEDRRFQRGLFDVSHGMRIGGTTVPGPAALLRLMEKARQHHRYSVQTLQQLSKKEISLEESFEYEYGMALIKTSASVGYTVKLAALHALEAVTDSESHFRLLERTCSRNQITLQNHWVSRENY
ncbi:MAG: hypothetical protein C4293_05780 [Nitrospiraceae bacterium]